ncbi:hypothetical protein [Bradyrhizobium sp.]|uniref:hypothetical protein n=1 Tax=Bradyrhizobium sp. TaxID=376 RepID=UPI004037AFC7
MNLVIATAMMAAAGLTSTLAQAQWSEPSAFAAQNPDRDVLNGGQLTPYGRAIRGQQYEGTNAAFASQARPSSGAPVTHSRRRHQ